MKIHKEGYTILIVYFVVMTGLLIATEEIFPEKNLLHYIFYFLCFLSLAFVGGFFRSPKRETEDELDFILCPADGKVVVIEKVYDDEYFNEERLQVSIFMSPLNVHVNWYPISGLVKYFNYMPGKYLVAWHPKSSSDNERTTTVIQHRNGDEILVRQIAGAMARRIVCYAKPSTEVKQGSELGFIKFGSRLDVLLPLNSHVKVELGQKVVGKMTVLASFSA